MIALENVYKFYRTQGRPKVVLDHVTTVFEPGHSYGLLGVNGAGKSTTLRLISGVELPNGGKIRRSARVSWPLGFANGFHPMMTGTSSRASTASRPCARPASSRSSRRSATTWTSPCGLIPLA